MTSLNLLIRNIVFGVSDAVVSTVGILSGVSVSGMSVHMLITTGIISSVVASTSMSVGSFLSEESAQEVSTHAAANELKAIEAGAIMFGAWFITSLLPLLPYLFIPMAAAFWVSVVIAVVALLFVGAACGILADLNPFKHSIKMAGLGIAAIILGVAIGNVMGITAS